MAAKLEDLKMLKVPELRSRLKNLGLDSKGLKVELVGRLWSAIDGGLESKVKTETTARPLVTISTKKETVYLPTQSSREYAEKATQTDSDFSELTVAPDPSGSGSGPRDQDQAQQKPQDEEDSTVEDGKNVKRDLLEMGKGRAFYEFKEEIKYKRTKFPPLWDPLMPVTEESVKEDRNIVKIDLYNSDLHFEVDPDGAGGHPQFWDRFPLLWSGCRLTHGVQQNRVGFEVKLERLLTSQPQVQHDVELESFGLRIGWSVASTSLLLGQDYLSFAYDGRGKKVSYGIEDNYGEPLSMGDIVGSYASFSSGGTVELSFYKNGLFLGVAYSLDASALQGQPLFPHVFCRSCSIRFLLDPMVGAWYPSPLGFTPLIALSDEQNICAVSAPQSKSQCEVIVMVGFPGSGKTHWAKNHINQHPEKHYRLLSTVELLASMITGAQRETRLQQASQCLTELIKLASKRPGNYILDQCNILFSARHYKLQLFEGFRRKVMVIFPSKEEWKKRLLKHQIKEEQIPQNDFLKLQVSCTLPEQDDLLEELHYMELSQPQAQTVLQEYKDEARQLLPPAPKNVERKQQHCKKRPYPHCQTSHKTRCTWQNGWNHLHSWSQQQQFWPAPCIQGYYYNSS